MSMTVRRGVSSESGTKVSPAFGLMPTGVQWIQPCALGMVRPTVCADAPGGGFDVVGMPEDGDLVGDRAADPANAGERADGAHGALHVFHVERHVHEVKPQVLERGVMNGG